MNVRIITLLERWNTVKYAPLYSNVTCPFCEESFIKDKSNRRYCSLKCCIAYNSYMHYDDKCSREYRKRYYDKEFRENNRSYLREAQRDYMNRSKIGKELHNLNGEELLKFIKDIELYKNKELAMIWNCSVYSIIKLKNKLYQIKHKST